MDWDDKVRYGTDDQGEGGYFLSTPYGGVNFDTLEEMLAYKRGLEEAEENGTVDEFLETA